MVVAIRRSTGEIAQANLESSQLEAGDAIIAMGKAGVVPGFLQRGTKDTGLL